MKIKTGIRKKEAEDYLLTTPSNLNEMIELTEISNTLMIGKINILMISCNSNQHDIRQINGTAMTIPSLLKMTAPDHKLACARGNNNEAT
jgi:hypothetical protein